MKKEYRKQFDSETAKKIEVPNDSGSTNPTWDYTLWLEDHATIQEQTIKELRENKAISDNLMVSSQRKATKWAKEVIDLEKEIESLRIKLSNRSEDFS